MTPETIGLAGSRMVLGRHTGRHGFADRCKQLGYKLAKDEVEQAYQRFLEIADKKKEVFDEDIAAIINDEIRRGRAGLRPGVPARRLAARGRCRRPA